MKFRTEIEIPRQPLHDKNHDSKLLMLGSYFTDNIGQQLSVDGFDVMFNPMGPLYNPLSILRSITLAMYPDSSLPTYASHESSWHCLDFASRHSPFDIDALKQIVDRDLEIMRRRIIESDSIIIILGTAVIFSMNDNAVGNCHKLPVSKFTRRKLSVEECISVIFRMKSMLPEKTVIFTVSPIRHVADTLHGNQVSKSTLLFALHSAMENNPEIIYFPAYEIMLDDLRDYRFYATDLKHPSETAIQNIYEVFSGFNSQTKRKKSKSLPQTIKAAGSYPNYKKCN